MSRGRGRPPLPKAEKKRNVINLKVDDAELKAIDRRAKELRLTRSELVREAIRRILSR
jgi:metal-responsive CopG/Arc/MetJ family transcriptional regulator